MSRAHRIPDLKQSHPVSLGKDVGENKDHAWFVSYAPASQPEIAVVALIENVGFGGTHSAPAARAIFQVYYQKARQVDLPEEQIAQAQTSDEYATGLVVTAGSTVSRWILTVRPNSSISVE